MFFFCKQDMVGNTLKYLSNKKMVKTETFNVLTVMVVSVTSLSEILILTCCETSRQKKANKPTNSKCVHFQNIFFHMLLNTRKLLPLFMNFIRV